jgi:hypothetical protein
MKDYMTMISRRQCKKQMRLKIQKRFTHIIKTTLSIQTGRLVELVQSGMLLIIRLFCIHGINTSALSLSLPFSFGQCSETFNF